MCPKDANGLVNSGDPDQTALQEQSDLGLHYLLKPICPKTKELKWYSNILKLNSVCYQCQGCEKGLNGKQWV